MAVIREDMTEDQVEAAWLALTPAQREEHRGELDA